MSEMLSGHLISYKELKKKINVIFMMFSLNMPLPTFKKYILLCSSV
jgi:hypothetical protein